MTETRSSHVPCVPVSGSNFGETDFGISCVVGSEAVFPGFEAGDTVVEVVTAGAT
jgi:hypothetical protein